MIHKYSLNGYNIVLDVHSGAVHLVDDLSLKLLDYADEKMQPECPGEAVKALSGTYSGQEIAESYKELYDLYKDGLLFSQDDYAQFAERMVAAPIKSMCLNVAHDCNLRCQYCFASTGDFGGERKLMPLEVGKKAIDFLIENSKGRKNLELDFFGGEPLMNFGVVKEVVKYARSIEKEHNKNFRFTITTNGLLLDDDKIDFINREMSNVVLSLDGRREVNDRLRIRVDGSGSYDSILPKYKKLVDKRAGKEYYIRGTFTTHNLDFSEDVFHLYDKGFDQISVEPVVSDPKLEYSIKEGNLPAVFKEYEKLAKRLIEVRKGGGKINFFHFMVDLDQGPCAIKRLRGCSCGNEYVAVTPEGDIYPCHQFVGKAEWIMGNVLDGSYSFPMKERFARTTVYQKETCKNCWAKFYCSGGCNANNLEYARDILKPHTLACELEKKRVECAIMIKAALSE